MTYICDRCGKRVPAKDAFEISRFFNGLQLKETVCRECIKKIGEEEGDPEDEENNLR